VKVADTNYTFKTYSDLLRADELSSNGLMVEQEDVKRYEDKTKEEID